MSDLLLVNTCSRSAEIAYKNTVFYAADLTEDLGGAEALSVLLEQVPDLTKIEKICFISGPGSYTGLRVGCSFCLGLSLGLNLKAVSFSTFIAHSACTALADGYLGIFIPASPVDFYYSEFKADLNLERWLPNIDYEIVDKSLLEEFTNSKKKSLITYQFKIVDEFFSLPKDPSSVLTNLNICLSADSIDWKGHLKLDKLQELIYIKPVAAKSLAERKKL